MPSRPVRNVRRRGARSARSSDAGNAPLPAAWAAVVAVACLLGAAAAAAQTPVIRNDEDLAFDRPEAWAMKYFTAVSLMGDFGPPERRRPGSLEVGLELGWIPEIDERDRQVGFQGTKVEDVNKAPVFVRPRLLVGLPHGFTLTAGYVPPVAAFDVEAHLLALSLGRPLLERGAWRLGASLGAQAGSVRSDITCPNEIVGVADPAVNPSDCRAPSDDRITMRYAGLAVAAARDAGDGRWVPYAALSADWLDMAFQVDALTFGVRDRTLLTADGFTWSAAAGLRYRQPSGATLAVEAHYTPLSVRRDGGSPENDPLLHVRVLAGWRWR